MDKKLVITVLMLCVMIAFLLKATNLPGVGIICTLCALFASTLFYVFFLAATKRSKLANLISSKIRYKTTDENTVDENEKSTKILKLVEPILMLGLSVLTIAGLFKLQSWPGSNVVQTLGLIMVGIGAVAILFTINTKKCNYSSEIKQVAMASLVYGALLGTNFMYTSIKEVEYREMPHYVEVYKAKQEQPSNENMFALIEESWKATAFKNTPTTYNQLYDLESKANQQAENDSNAIVLYIISHTENRGEECFNKERHAAVPVSNYLDEIKDRINNNTTFYLISNEPEKAKQSVLSHCPQEFDNSQIIIMQ